MTDKNALTFSVRSVGFALRGIRLMVTDVASPTFHPIAGQAKDVAAGAVLLTAIGAVIIGVLVFWPKISALLHG